LQGQYHLLQGQRLAESVGEGGAEWWSWLLSLSLQQAEQLAFQSRLLQGLQAQASEVGLVGRCSARAQRRRWQTEAW